MTQLGYGKGNNDSEMVLTVRSLGCPCTPSIAVILVIGYSANLMSHSNVAFWSRKPF